MQLLPFLGTSQADVHHALNAKAAMLQATHGPQALTASAGAPRRVRVAAVSLQSVLARFLDQHFAAPVVEEFKRINGEDPTKWVSISEQTIPTEVDVLRIRHLVRFWVSYDADREDITQRMLDMKDLLIPFRPTSPVRVFRNEKLKGEDGWKEQYDFASAWSVDMYDAKVFGDKDRRLVTSIAQPEDILVSVPLVDMWAQVYELGVVDADRADEVVVIPHPSFESEREEIPDDEALAQLRKDLWEPVVDAWRAEAGDVPANALAEAAKLVDGLEPHQVPELEEKLKDLPKAKEKTAGLTRLFHVGRLDEPRKAPDFSCEGSGLSCSKDPNKWRAMAQLGDAPVWELSKSNPKFYRFERPTPQAIKDWCAAKGWLIPWNDGYETYHFGPKGEAWWRQAFTTEMNHGRCLMFAQVWWASAQGGYDGVFWPGSGIWMIFQEKLPSWQKTELPGPGALQPKTAAPLALPEGMVDHVATELISSALPLLKKMVARGAQQLGELAETYRPWTQIGLFYDPEPPAQANGLRSPSVITYELCVAREENIKGSLVTMGSNRNLGRDGKQTTEVVIALNPTRSIPDAITELSDPGSEGYRSLLAMLSHEITHAFGHNYPGTAKVPDGPDWNEKAYFNHPKEMDAFTQEMVTRAKGLGGASIRDMVSSALQEPRWRMVSQHLTEANRREILREVYKAADREMSPRAAKLLQPKLAALPDLRPLVDEFMEFLDPEHKCSTPDTEIVNRVNETWLGLCTPKGWNVNAEHIVDDFHSLLSFQKGALANAEVARRVVAHEVAHHVADSMLVLGFTPEVANVHMKTLRNHGASWQALAAKLNARYGADFCTVLSDARTTAYERKEVYLFVVTEAEHVLWCWATTVPQKVVDRMRETQNGGSGVTCFIGRTTSRWLVLPEAKGPTFAYVKLEEQKRAIYEAMNDQKNLWPDYASGVKAPAQPRAKRWTLIMVNPGRSTEPRWINAWSLGRPLIGKEERPLSLVVGQLDRQIKTLAMLGDEGLFKVLPPLHINDVVHNPGLAPDDVMAESTQEWLMELWPQGTAIQGRQSVTSAKLLLPKWAAAEPPAFLDYMIDAVTANQKGFFFEEGGCYGMALALYEALKPLDPSCVLRLRDDGFAHAYAKAFGKLWDYQGPCRERPGTDFSNPAAFIAACGQDEDEIVAAKTEAERVIRTAQEMAASGYDLDAEEDGEPRTASAQPIMGFNVNDDDQDYTDMILDGRKTIETRNSPSLSAHLGERVGIISTRKRGTAGLVGTCVLGEPKIYKTNEEFRADQQAHQVPEGPDYDLQPGAVKYGYPITQVERCKPTLVHSQGRVWRKLAATLTVQPEDPGLMTLEQFLHQQNPGDTHHPSESYDYDLEHLNQDYSVHEVGRSSDDTTVCFQHAHGYTFRQGNELVGVSDGSTLWVKHPLKGLPNRYHERSKYVEIPVGGAVQVKYPADFLYKVFDPAQRTNETYPVVLQNLGDYQVRAEADPRTSKHTANLALVHNGMVVAIAQNEWGATLISVAKEYRGRNLGPLMHKYWYQFNPDFTSGGYTPAGQRMAMRVWSDRVRELLSHGVYSDLVAQGQMAQEQVNLILKDVQDRRSSAPTTPEATTGTGKFLLYTDDITFVLYDAAFLENQDASFIKGFGFMRDSDPVGVFFYTLDYEPTFRETATAIALQMAKDEGQPLYVGQGYGDMLEPEGLPVERKGDYLSLIKNVMDIRSLAARERAERKKVDPYGEIEDLLLEEAHSKDWQAPESRKRAKLLQPKLSANPRPKAWMEPNGTIHELPGYQEHAFWAMKYLKLKRTTEEDPIDLLRQQGWARLGTWVWGNGHGSEVCIDTTRLSSDQLHALQSWIMTHPDWQMTNVELGTNKMTMDEFLTTNNPAKLKTSSGPVATNASGAPIHATPEGIANFWRWFGASKTVDGQGQPMVFHHGTPTGGFEAFDPNALGSNTGSASSHMGFFFTPDLAAAEHYAHMIDPLGTALGQMHSKINAALAAQGLTGKIYTGYSEGSLFMSGDWRSQLPKQPTAEEVRAALVDAMHRRLEDYKRLAQQFRDDVARKAKPKKWELAAVEKATKSMADAGRAMEIIQQELNNVTEFKADWGTREIKDVYLRMLNPLVEDHQGRRLGRSFAEIIVEAKKGGHDGVVILNTEDPKPMDVYIVFEPTQIKGVENQGSFSTEDARLVASRHAKLLRAKVVTREFTPAEGENITPWDAMHIAVAVDDELSDAVVTYVQENFSWSSHPELRDRLIKIIRRGPSTTKPLYRAELQGEGSPEDGQRGFRSWSAAKDTAIYLGNHMVSPDFALRSTGGAPVKALSIEDFAYWRGRVLDAYMGNSQQAEYLVLDSSLPKRVLKKDTRYAKLLQPKLASRFKIYLDMDGVLADYMRGAKEAGVPPDEWLHVPGAFRNLALLPGAREAVAKLQCLAPGCVHILSKPADDRWVESCQEKREWMAEHFPSIPPEHIALVMDKGAVGAPGDVLLDDHPEWAGAEDFPGTVIHFTGPRSWEQLFAFVERHFARLPQAVNE